MTNQDLHDFIADRFTLSSVLHQFGQEVYENNPELEDHFTEQEVVKAFVGLMTKTTPMDD